MDTSEKVSVIPFVRLRAIGPLVKIPKIKPFFGD
jgi:hypothetical protein